MPNNIAMPAIGAPYNAWIWNVSQRKAPGAISAMALIVSPVNPRLPVLLLPADCGVLVIMTPSRFLGRAEMLVAEAATVVPVRPGGQRRGNPLICCLLCVGAGTVGGRDGDRNVVRRG